MRLPSSMVKRHEELQLNMARRKVEAMVAAAEAEPPAHVKDVVRPIEPYIEVKRTALPDAVVFERPRQISLVGFNAQVGLSTDTAIRLDKEAVKRFPANGSCGLRVVMRNGGLQTRWLSFKVIKELVRQYKLVKQNG